MSHRRAALGAFIAALALAGGAGAVEDPGFVTLDAVGEGTRVGFTASLGLRRGTSGERDFTGRFDLFGHAPLTADFALHARLAAAYAPVTVLVVPRRIAGAGNFELDERFALYGAELGGAWLLRSDALTLPLALTLALPLVDRDPHDLSVRGAALSARLAAWPTTWSDPALRISAAPVIDRDLFRVRFDAGVDVRLSDPDAFGYETGVRVGGALSVHPGPVAIMAEVLWYGALGDFSAFGGYDLALGVRWLASLVRPSLHVLVPAGDDLAAEDVIWWVLGLDWAPAESAAVRSDR